MKKGSQLHLLTLLLLRTLTLVVVEPESPCPMSMIKVGCKVHGENQVWARLAGRLRDAPATFPPTTDGDSDLDDQAQTLGRKIPKGVSGKLRTADTTVVHQVLDPTRSYSHPQASQQCMAS